MKVHMRISKNLIHGRLIKSWIGSENMSERARSGELEVLLKIFRSDRGLSRSKVILKKVVIRSD